MKLSIIVPVFKKEKELKKLLTKMTEQTSKDFQLVLVVDTNKENVLETIEGYKTKLKSKIKVVFNSSRSGRASATRDGAKVATGLYSIIMSSSDVIKKTFVEESIKLIEKSKADIIEFNATFKEPIKFDGKIRLSVPKKTMLADRKEIVAYSYFLDFNKFIKTSVLKKTVTLVESTELNSRYSIDLSAKIFSVATSYANAKKTLVVSKSPIQVSYNPLKLIKQWEELLRVIERGILIDNYKSEVSYAAYSLGAIFLFSLTAASKNKVLTKKLIASHKKLMEGPLSNFFETNQYMMKKTYEAKLLQIKSSPAAMSKLYKEMK